MTVIEKNVTLPAGTIKRVHVDQLRLRSNAAGTTDLPPVTVQARGGPYKGYEVDIDGPSTLVYADHPLSCGARVWVETRAAVHIIADRSERTTP